MFTSTQPNFAFSGTQSSLATTSTHPALTGIASQLQYARFCYPFFNKKTDVNIQYGKPEKMPEEMYLQALQINPDNKTMYPVLAQGFEGLKERLVLQEKAQQAHSAAIQGLKTYMEQLTQAHTLEVSVTLEEYKVKQMNNATRVLRLMKRLELLQHRHQPLLRGEEQIITRLENYQHELNQPDQYKARLNQAMSKIRMQEDNGPVPYPSLEEEDQLQICKILDSAGKGLQVLIEDMQKDSEALQIIYDRFFEAVHNLNSLGQKL
eukprot:TRINITY_DN12159_c0_g2_i5.p1 TRINITY_DN12159_c0_g2~~TRINITY_DN12159_c0_g2_i5.p1  ORF type:complete len:264 (-),score=50.66 TRINITY_DN12159_c0_g2_i5:110-901(-)